MRQFARPLCQETVRVVASSAAMHREGPAYRCSLRSSSRCPAGLPTRQCMCCLGVGTGQVSYRCPADGDPTHVLPLADALPAASRAAGVAARPAVLAPVGRHGGRSGGHGVVGRRRVFRWQSAPWCGTPTPKVSSALSPGSPRPLHALLLAKPHGRLFAWQPA